MTAGRTNHTAFASEDTEFRKELHDWEFQDDSFDHEFGTEQIFYYLCTICGEVRDYEGDDFDE